MNLGVNTSGAALRRYTSLLKLSTGVAALAAATVWTAPALAQSTASQQMEEIIVTGNREQSTVGGLITAETASKARSTISQEFISTQAPGQSVAQLINLLPGVSFTNADPYGNSGGNLRLRGFDGNRVSLTFDGMPLNDTGNYAIYTNQQLDSEIISRVNVNLGTTDVDSPTASAAGGTINYVTRKPKTEPGVEANVSYGSYAYHRFFTVADTGELGPYKTSAFVSGSYTNYNKFRGYGDLEKKQFNGRIYQPLKGDDFISIAAHYNENRNYSYRYVTKAEIAANGWGFDYSSRNPASVNDFYGSRINPSDTGNIRGQSRFTLSDNLTLTVDPYIQYTLATGGTVTSTVSETDSRLVGSATGIRGVDLNGNCAGAVVNSNGVRVIPTGLTSEGCGDASVRINQSSITNTWRPGVTSSLIYDVNEDHRLRVAYTLDYGRHRQTGEAAMATADGFASNPFAGKKGTPIITADGSLLRSRDRFSIAELNQVAAEYQGKFLEDTLRANVGVRLPFFKRELNQYCYSTTGTSVYCTTGTPQATTVNNVANLPIGSTATSTPVGVLAPFETTRKFDEVLPNVGLTYSPIEDHTIYFNYSKGLSVPRTDSLYARTNPGRAATATTVVPYSDSLLPEAESEKADNFDAGYRYEGSFMVASLGVYYNKFTNYILSSVSPEDTTTRIDRNVGDVEGYGLNAEVGVEPLEGLTTYLSFSYDHRELQDDVPIGLDRYLLTQNGSSTGVVTSNLRSSAPSPYYYVQNGVVYLRTTGKQLVEVPEITIGGRVQYEYDRFQIGLNAKYTGKRYSTDVNDESTPSRTIFDLDASYALSDFIGEEGSRLQLNIDNLFDKEYLSSINSGSTASAFLVNGNPFTPQYYIGSPRTIRVSLNLVY